MMIFYWILPYRNPFMLPVLFLVTYIAIAWYDYLYNCSLKLYSGTYPISISTLDAWAKPQRCFEESPNLVKEQELVYKKKIYALHSIFIAPFLFYIGYYGKKSNNNIWSVVGTVSFIALLYHGLRIIYPREITCEENKQEQSTLLYIYIFHLSFVIPLLAYIAYNGKNSDNRVWYPLLILSVILFTYHGIRYFHPRVIKENC